MKLAEIRQIVAKYRDELLEAWETEAMKRGHRES